MTTIKMALIAAALLSLNACSTTIMRPSDIDASTTTSEIQDYAERAWAMQVSNPDYASSYDLECAHPLFLKAVKLQLKAQQMKAFTEEDDARNNVGVYNTDETIYHSAAKGSLASFETIAAQCKLVRQNESMYPSTQSMVRPANPVQMQQAPVYQRPMYQQGPFNQFNNVPRMPSGPQGANEWHRIDENAILWTASDAACSDPEMAQNGYSYTVTQAVPLTRAVPNELYYITGQYGVTHIGCWNPNTHEAFTVRKRDNMGFTQHAFLIDASWSHN